MMDSNKDEANQCIKIGLRFLRLGNVDKAKKMFEKSHRLFPSKRAQDLLEDIQKQQHHSKREDKKEANQGASSSSEGQPRRRKGGHSKETTATRSTSETKSYTDDQVTVVNRVLKCKDFYEVLSVCKESTDAEIKKAYKKLALKLHPDKNTAPGAVEAFKKVGNAVSILTDTEKRKHYDLYGPEEAVASSNQQSNFHADYYDTHSFHSAEDLFNRFSQVQEEMPLGFIDYLFMIVVLSVASIEN